MINKIMELINKNENVTKIFAKTIEKEAIEQITELINYDPYMDCKVRIMPDVHAGKGCVIGTTIHLHDMVTPNLVGVDIGCIDCDTEILTPKGWIKISEYKGGEIMQFNPETNKGTYKNPLLFIKKPCNNFYHFKNSKGMDQMVSDEHNMLVYYGKKYINFYEKKPSYFNNIKSIDKGYYRFNTCFNIENEGVDLSDDLIRIDIMIQADGRIKKYDDYNFVELHFRKERKIQRAIKLLEKSNINYKLRLLKDGSTNISFHIIKEVDKTLKKYWKANHSQLEIIAEECLLWDGHKGYRSFYSTNIKENADIIQYAFIATNIRASIYISKNNNPNQNDCYVVIPTKNKYVGYNKKPRIETSVDGFKYCFTTQEGYFICRRNGYTFITGNCGMHVIALKNKEVDLCELDNVINKCIPSGFNVHDMAQACFDLSSLRCAAHIDLERANLSLGTLGGGNHFIELDANSSGDLYLVIHSGSRNLGVQVCKYYQDLAVKSSHARNIDKTKIINDLKHQGRESEIQSYLTSIKNKHFNKKLAHLYGSDFDDYIHDMNIVQKYADVNRKTIAKIILNNSNIKYTASWSTIHNYIDTESMILRKGAVRANLGEFLIIPMNMRDGSLICVGKGNEDWNCSAPHGAGRIMSRSKAKEFVPITDFTQSMNGIYSTSIGQSTIDEAPQVYKPMKEIIDCIGDTVDVVDIIKPIYNFKAH